MYSKHKSLTNKKIKINEKTNGETNHKIMNKHKTKRKQREVENYWETQLHVEEKTI